MTPSLFNRVVEGLCHHASRLQPDALPDIADLSVAYIKGISHSCQHPGKAYKFQCQVFNGTLQAVSLPSEKTPYGHVSHNWRAITILLSLSSSLERPLIIEEESYRAIRQVLLALPKTASERDTASTLSSSWPPYRILRDGMEEKTDTQEYLSRVVKAGFMMQEGGYSKKEIDLTTDVLGGMAPDGSPTVQTRANYPRHLRVEQGTWAALIRTTRNAQEAWALFKNPPEPGMRPTFEVYWELMAKLAAEPADPGHYNLPGDGREVFPFNDRNFSDFEKARINPPSIPKLIEEMFNAGVAIRGRTLAWLLRQAPNVETALEYTNHSSLDEALKSKLRWCLKEYQRPPSNPPTKLPPSTDLPRDILHATIDFVCRLQPNRTANTPDYLPNNKLYPIHHALRLAQTGWKSTHASGRAPWESIMLALGRPNIMVSNNVPRDNDIEVVNMAFKVLEKAEEHSALSLGMVDSFAQAVRKAVYSRLPILLEHASSASTILPEDEEFMSLYVAQSTEFMVPNGPHVFRKPDSANVVTGSWRQILTPVFKSREERTRLQTPCRVVREASERLKAAWRVLSTKASARQPYVDPRVTASHINGYMRTLAAVGDLEEMALLLCWVVRDWAPTAGGDLSLADARRLSRAAIVFRAFAEPLLDEGVLASLREEVEVHSEKGGPVHWPTDQEVEHYIQGDEWGNHRNLQEVIKLATASKQEHQLLETQRNEDVDQSWGTCKIR
ncbi:prefoldin subunit [Colletotrichum incanum]|nr:prefoldin subunit [Colletotrichum incanum]